MQGSMKKLLLTTAVGMITVFLPVSFTPGSAELTVTSACAGSCAPRHGWDCIHGDVVRENKCDPDSRGCISAAEEEEIAN